MVGVPGRSKACHNCRQRKIRCGGERPGCQNCAKTNRLCSGYQRNNAFILSRDMKAEGLSSSRDLPCLISEAGSGIILFSRWSIDQDKPSHGVSKANNLPVQAINTYLPMLRDISPRNAFREKLASLFMDYHLPRELIDSARQAVERRNWLLLVLELPTLTPALENAVLALCTARLGRYNDHQALVYESLSLYTSSLRELRLAVLNPTTRREEQNIAACMALATYEVIECPGKTNKGYMSHYNGAMKLLQIRGPSAHISGLAHSVFEALRRHSIFQGLELRSTNFLTEPDWRELPWASCPTSKSPHDELVDIFLEIPLLSAQSDAAEVATDTHEKLFKTIENVRESQRMGACLADWFSKFEATSAGSLYYPKLSKMNSLADNLELGKVFPVAFYFPAFSVAQTLVFYWAALIVVHGHMCFVYEKLAHLVKLLVRAKEDRQFTSGYPDSNDSEAAMMCLHHAATDLLSSLGSSIEWPCAPARNICQSVEYFLQEKMRGEGPLSILPALLIVKAYWKFNPGDWSHEILWVDDMISKIQGKGNEIAGYYL